MISPILSARLSEYIGVKPLEELMRGFPNEMIEKANRYRQEADAYRYVLGRRLLQKGIQEIGYSGNVLEQITYSDLGKPLLDDVWFSISHSEDWILCVISTEGPIGIDVEAIRPMDKPSQLRSWFSDDEWAQIQRAPDPLRALYHWWTKKEALLKAVGCGLSGLESIQFIGENQVRMKGEEKIWTVKDLGFSNEEQIVGHICY